MKAANLGVGGGETREEWELISELVNQCFEVQFRILLPQTPRTDHKTDGCENGIFKVMI